MESWKIKDEIQLGLEIFELIKDKWELGSMDFDLRVEKNYLIGDFNYSTKE